MQPRSQSRKSMTAISKPSRTATIPDSTSSPKTLSPLGRSRKPHLQPISDAATMLPSSTDTANPVSLAEYIVPKTAKDAAGCVRTARTRLLDSPHPRNNNRQSLAEIVAPILFVIPAPFCEIGNSTEKSVLMGVRENLCRPSGTGSVIPLYPALKRWAKFARPSGAKFLGMAFHRIVRNPVLTHTLEAAPFRGKSRGSRSSESCIALEATPKTSFLATHSAAFLSIPNSESTGADNSDALPEFPPPPRNSRASARPRR